jgi:transcriptional regulator with XRE-family HTH domain
MGKRHKRPAPESLAGIIAARIKSLEVSAYWVAKRSGVDASTVLRLIKGERMPTLETADKLCRALDLVLMTRPGSTLSLDLMRERHAED